MNPTLRRSAAHVFVDSVEAPFLAGDDEHHLVRVLRLRNGQTVTVTDGDGRWRVCRFGLAGSLQPDGEIEFVVAPAPRLSIGFALPKGDRPEWIVQKLTEIGVDRIIVVGAERSIVRWDDAKVARQLDRLRKVAREASMQSRRVRLPEIVGPTSLVELDTAGTALAEPGGTALSLDSPTILIGPEGGWSEAELEIVPRRVELGATILRVETAALVAASQLAALRARPATL